MTTKSFLDCERRNIEKMKKLQLPNYFKRIGFGVFILSFLALFINKFTFNDLDFRLISKYGMLVGLLLVSISKEKIEDELIIRLRMQSYTFAFVFGVIYALVLPLIVNVIGFLIPSKEVGGYNVNGDFVILWMLLSLQVFYFELLKKLHK